MNKIGGISSELSSGFDELDDDVFDLDTPIRPNEVPGTQRPVYSSQLSSFAFTFDRVQSANRSVASNDDDSGLNSSMTTSESFSPFNNFNFDAQTSPFTFSTPSQQIVERRNGNSEPIETPNTPETDETKTDSDENSSSDCEIHNSEEVATNSGESFDESKYLSFIPASIRSWYNRIHEKCTDYSFAHYIAGQMCHRTFPIDCYHSAKLGLMLSIISTHSREMQPISVIAIGRDGVTMSTLMNQFRLYAQRSHIPSDDLKIVRSHRNGIFVEANSLLLATNGVCFIGDWSSYNASSSAYIKNVLDSGRIVVDAQTNIEFPLKCAIWSYWFHCGARKAIENVMMFSNVFGIPVVFEENLTDSLIDAMLEANCGRDESDDDTEDELHISAADMKIFFNIIGQRPVDFSIEAESLIKEYFMATRLQRATLFSQRALEILRKMSACHAKLCLRDYVHRNDVVACIVLCEKFIFQIHGIEKSNAPFLGPVQHPFAVELYMQSFEKWLDGNLGVFGRRSGIN